MVIITEDENHGNINRENLIYAFSHCETWLEDYAKTIQAPQHELTIAVAELLLLQRQGALQSMPALSGKASKMDKGSRKMALAKRAYRKARRKSVSPKLKTSPLKGRKYNGTHWMQKPENKARVIKMMRVRAEKRAA